MNPKFKMRGYEEVQAFLKDLPYGSKQVVLPAVSEYIVGDDDTGGTYSHGLRHYPAPQGQKYVRTYVLRYGWEVRGGVYRQVIVNPVSYAPYVPRRWAKYGWREWAEVVASNLSGAIRHANAKLVQWLKEKGYDAK